MSSFRGDQKEAGSNTNESSHSHYHHANATLPAPEPIESIDWQRVLSDSSLVPCFLEEPAVRETVGKSRIDSTTAGLTYIPWELKVKAVAVVVRDDLKMKDLDTTASISISIPVTIVAPSTTANDEADNKDAHDVIDSNNQKPAAIVMSKNGTSNSSSTDHDDSSSTLAQQHQQPYFPVDLATGQLTDYLSLRRQQNRAWADERLHTGIQFAKDKKYVQAEKAYQQGLDLVPNHVDLMVAAAALHANQGTVSGNGNRGGRNNYHQTRALQLLEQALRENPQHANAIKYKLEIEAHQQKQHLAVTLAATRPAKADRAMQDASLERSFEIGRTNSGVASASAVNNNNATAYPLLGSDSEHDHDDDDDDKRRKKKRKHKKRHKKRSKRHHGHRRRSSSYYDSDSDTDNDSEDDSVVSSRKRSRGKTKRKDKKRSRGRKEELEPTKETTAGVVPELVVDNKSHHDKDNDYDTEDSSQEESRRGYKSRRKDRKHKRRRLSMRDDVSSSGAPSDSGETVDSLQIGRERKKGRPATRAFRHEDDRDDETKGDE